MRALEVGSIRVSTRSPIHVSTARVTRSIKRPIGSHSSSNTHWYVGSTKWVVRNGRGNSRRTDTANVSVGSA